MMLMLICEKETRHKSITLMLSAPIGASAPLSPTAQATIKKHLPKLFSQHLSKRNAILLTNARTVDVGCLTDLSSKEHLTEIEILSLLEEQIPKYKIRSNLLTDFTGYPSQDWYIPAPALSIPLEGLGLTSDQTRETLNYFLLCGIRVSQMTRTYDDIEAVTRLLEEKEKDLELTVQIGKELLSQNNTLEIKITNLEADLKECCDDRSQLLHDLHKKTELIEILTSDVCHGCETDSPTLSKSVTVDLLQRKISLLQDENEVLKVETVQLVSKTDEFEEHERKLMTDITTQLNQTNSLYDSLKLELEQKREENRLQDDQIVCLSAKLGAAEIRLHQMSNDNEEHIALLKVTKETQNCLALELIELKQRYQEVLSLLQETQDKLRKHRKKIAPHARSSFIATNGFLNPESLHSELMDLSLYSENSLDSGISGDNYRMDDTTAHSMCNAKSRLNNQGSVCSTEVPSYLYKKMFETVHCANNHLNDKRNSIVNQVCTMDATTSFESIMSATPYLSNIEFPLGSRAGDYPDDLLNWNSVYKSENANSRSVLEESSLSKTDDAYPSQSSGVPGAPGAKDLEAALRRLTTSEILYRRSIFPYGPLKTQNYHDNHILMRPLGITTTETVMSTGTSGFSSTTNMSSSVNQWRLPDKLQIVKPIEGSQTLNHWSKLATPTLSGLLEERPGVAIRGGRGLSELGIQTYTLSDIEEDVSEDLPRKKCEPLNCIYTYTTSLVMHPDDIFIKDSSFRSQSQISSMTASNSTSRPNSCSSTPKSGLSRKNSCSTFSVNVGLATMLNERGIRAVTPSALNTPVGQNFSPTVTPCNSPEESPRCSIVPEHIQLISSATKMKKKKKKNCEDFLKINQQTQHGIVLSHLERRGLRSLKLVEKVENIGLQNIITVQPNKMLYPSCDNASHHSSSSTNIKHDFTGMLDEINFDRDQIKGVLYRGLSSFVFQNKYINDIDMPDTINTEIQNKPYAFNNITRDGCTISQRKSNMQSILEQSKQVPRQKSRRVNLKNGTTSQRRDLGTVIRQRRDFGNVSLLVGIKPEQPYETLKFTRKNSNDHEQQSITQSFVGSISSLLFGRKGGWL